jgi:site-specific DNA-methyltransferase (adenine-specific)
MTPYFEDGPVTVYQGHVLDVLRQMPDESVNCVVTSPPYWGLRDYGTAEWQGGFPHCDHRGRSQTSGASTLGEWKNGGGQRYKEETGGMPYAQVCGKCGAVRVDNQIGLEKTPREYIEKMVVVFQEIRRVLQKDGTCWVNLGDSYCASPGQRAQGVKRNDVAGWKQQTNAGCLTIGSRTAPRLKPKDLVGIPWRFAFALQDDGWWLRQDIIWSKPNPMPESVTDRCTKAHEYIFLLTKSERYRCDMEAIKEPCTQDESRPTFRGGAYVNNSTFDNGEGGNSTVMGNVRKIKMPDGWDTGAVSRWEWTGASEYIEVAGRASGNKTHKTVAEYEKSDSEEHRTAAGLLKIADTAYGTRNKRSVWTIASEPFAEAHFATFPQELIKPCILAGCPAGGVVLDPFAGSLTTMQVASKLNCKSVGIELNPEYIDIGIRCRLKQSVLDFTQETAI